MGVYYAYQYQGQDFRCCLFRRYLYHTFLTHFLDYRSFKTNLSKTTQVTFTQAENNLKNVLESAFKNLSLTVLTIATDPEITQMFADGDREGLAKALVPYYKSIEKRV